MKIGSIIKVIAFVSSAVQISYAAVADATWNAIVGKNVIMEMTDSQTVSVKILAYKDSMVTIVKEEGYIESIESKKVAAVKLDLSNQALKQDDSNAVTTTTTSKNPADKSFKKEKTCGPFIGLGPGIIGFNADIKQVNLFISSSFIYPIASEGETWTATIGAGKLIELGTCGWKLNTFTHLSFASDRAPEYYDTFNLTKRNYNVAAGLGVGFQYISSKGVLFSFKVPILGFNFNSNHITGEGVLMYYPYSITSMPCVVFGKCF